MKKINEVLIFLILIIIIVYGIIFFYFNIYFKTKNNYDYKISIIDTSYNKCVLDSIEYNINKKDSIIINIKNKIIYEMEQAINANDSDAIEQFYKLAGAD